MEYERRFRVRDLPDLSGTPEVSIRQVYWDLGDGWALRLRRIGQDFDQENVLAIKGPRDQAQRIELEWRLRDTVSPVSPAELVESVVKLYGAGSANQVVKTRHSLLDEYGQAWDIDRFHFDNEGLAIAEIELDQPSLLDQIILPTWLAEEVTDDPRYNNENLARTPLGQWGPD